MVITIVTLEVILIAIILSTIVIIIFRIMTAI